MRNLFLVTIFAFTISICTLSADPWDCMTEYQAKELLAFLEKNPFVFDYCDCCDEVSRKYDNRKIYGHLLKIEKMEIVKCSWDDTQYSVLILKSTVLSSGNIEEGKFYAAKAELTDLEQYNQNWPITLNYCWSVKSGKTSRLYQQISYDADEVNCNGLKEFPNPKRLPAGKNQKAYTKFIRRR